MARRIFSLFALLIMVGCNDPFKKKYQPDDFESDMQSILEKNKSYEKDVKLLTKSILVAQLEGADLRGRSYEDILTRLKDFEKETSRISELTKDQQKVKNLKLNQFITAQLLDKKFLSTNNGNFISYRVAFRNISAKGIKTLTGNFNLQDLLEKEIKNVFVRMNHNLPPNSSTIEVFNIAYDPHNDNDIRARVKTLTGMRTEWNPEQIVFDNGDLLE